MRGIDIETTSLSPEEGRLRLVQLSTAKGAQVLDMYHEDETKVKGLIREARNLVAHNAVFERKWLKAKLGLDIGVIHDTMIMSQVLYGGTKAALRSNFSHTLKSVVNRELKIEMDKEEQQSDWDALVLTPAQKRYAAFDAAVLPKLARKLLSRIDYAGLRETYELELRVAHAVDAMQTYGVAVHTDRLDAMIEDATEKAVSLKSQLEAE
jgi:ribonuclease D